MKWILLFLMFCVGCQTTGKLETKVNPYHLENTEINIVVEIK